MSRALRSIGVVVLALAAWPLVASNPGERILIRAGKPYTNVKNAVTSVGGQVVREFKYVDAIAAEIPQSGLAALKAIVGAAAITKDEELRAPRPIEVAPQKGGPQIVGDALNVNADAVDPLDVAALAAEAAPSPGVSSQQRHRERQRAARVGIYRLGVTVAVIDSGIRPGFPHLTLDGSVVGCEDFVLDALGCSNFANNGHGTFVAGMISANVIFTFAAASALRNAVLAECPGVLRESADEHTNPDDRHGAAIEYLRAHASFRQRRARRPRGSSRPSSARSSCGSCYNAGNPGGSNIRVVNMSLGGPTLAAGRDLIDQATDALLDHDIVAVIAAGNAGPSSLTTGSPGSAANALTVGAASLAHNERILNRLQFGPIAGNLYRPFLGAQTAYFSSRGPNADGRPDPDVVSNGFGNYGQGFGATANRSRSARAPASRRRASPASLPSSGNVFPAPRRARSETRSSPRPIPACSPMDPRHSIRDTATSTRARQRRCSRPATLPDLPGLGSSAARSRSTSRRTRISMSATAR